MLKIIPYQDQYKKQTIDLVLGILANEFNSQRIPQDNDLEKISQIYQNNKGNFWLALDDEKVIGIIALRNYEKGRGYLKRMYVASNYRGKGVAQKLLNTLIDFAKAKNYKTIFLGTEEKRLAANKFYLKEGFKKIAKIPSDLPDFGDTIFYQLSL